MRKSICALGALSLMLCACQTMVRKNTSAAFDWSSSTRRVVLVEPDVELGALEAGGGFEPRADWTASAHKFIYDDVAAHLQQKGAELVGADHLTDPHEVQIAKLHGAVGQAILLHLYNAALKLPSKGDALDWSLGPGAAALKNHYGADYALFVYIRDSYTSTGRALLMIGAAMFGVGVQGGQQTGFASLVDLRTGNIVWFNRIISGTGDLRTAAPAQKTVDDLLKDLPI